MSYDKGDGALYHVRKRAFGRFCACDAWAVGLGAALFLVFVFSAPLGFGVPDEPFYYTIAQRLLHGDRLLIDEWSASQLSSLFSFLPYWVFTRITGGTEGIILYMRYVFIAADAVFYAYMYVKLRRYRYAGLTAAFLFCAILPECNYAIDYFTVSSMAFTAVCLILLIDPREKSAGKLFFAGILVACAILAEPFLVFLYAVWCAAALVWGLKNKKAETPGVYGFLLHRRVWFWVTLGAGFVFLLFMGFLWFTGTLRDLRLTLPYLVTGEEYNSSNIIELSRLVEAIRLFGTVHIAGLLLCAAAAGVCRILRKKALFTEGLPLAQTAVFVLSVLFLIASYIRAGVHSAPFTDAGDPFAIIINHELPIMVSSLCWLLLCEKTDPRIFCLWCAGTLFSVCVDVSSAIMLTSGGRIVQTAGFIALGQFHAERLAPLRKKTRTRSTFRRALPAVSLRGAFLLLAAALVFWNASYIGAEAFFKPIEFIFSSSGGSAYESKMLSGPLRGVRTTAWNAEIYAKSLRDMDTVSAEAEGAPVFLVQMHPYLYLYTDFPYATFSSWDEEDDRARHVEYWKLFEKHRPKYAYVPYYYNFLPVQTYPLVQELQSIADCTVARGEAGYIISIDHFYDF